MPKIDVSIILIYYNTPKLLDNCIQSIQQHTKNINYEIIIIDNASQKKISKNITQQKDIVILNNEQNSGFGKANNQGSKLAKGQYLFLLNTDTLLIENSIKKCFDYISKNPSIGIIGPCLLNEDRTIQLYGSKLNHKQFKVKQPKEVSFISGAAMFISTSFYKEIGGFDENYFFYNEDIDLCLTIKRKGKQLIYFPNTSIIHLGGKSTKKSIQLQIRTWKSSWYFFKKNYLSKLIKKTSSRLTWRNL